MSDLKRKKQGLAQEVQRISKELRRLRRQQPTGGKLQIGAAQRTTARALMVMREADHTAAMAFPALKKKT